MNGSLEKQRKAFKADPENTRAFETLEEHYFLEGEWRQLVGLYRRRLQGEALREDPGQCVPLLFRLAQILQDRLENEEQAQELYKQCARLDPRYRPALARLRDIHSARGQWDVVLQIAEVENESNMPPEERADFLADMGKVWLDQLHDTEESLSRFQESLGIQPDHPAALAGLARTLELLGRQPAAAQAWERLVDISKGVNWRFIILTKTKL